MFAALGKLVVRARWWVIAAWIGAAFLTSMGVSASVGIALAAFVMALFLTPALTAQVGPANEWGAPCRA